MHRIQIEVHLSLTSRWHAGAGEGSTTVDRMIRKDQAGHPFLPGSTLKGLVRENCERLARTLRFPPPVDPHALDIRSPDCFGPLAGVTGPVEALFGNKFEGGELFFRDARRLDPSEPTLLTTISRTAMSRGLRTVKHKLLFSSEYAGPVMLRTVIDGFHRHLVEVPGEVPLAYRLLVAAVLNLRRVGGERSVGCGTVEIARCQVVYNKSAIPLEEVVKDLDPELYELCLQEVGGNQ